MTFFEDDLLPFLLRFLICFDECKNVKFRINLLKSGIVSNIKYLRYVVLNKHKIKFIYVVERLGFSS
jgi:hypothetical protein